jgi:hypothetical protein
MDERFHEGSIELVLLSIHNNNKETTINMGARRDIHGTSSQYVQHTSMLGCQYRSNSTLYPLEGIEFSHERKGAKHIQVLRIKYRRQITVVVSSSANGSMLPLQVVFQGTIN